MMNTELSIDHCYIEAPRGEYIYFEAFNHNKLYFLKKGYIRLGYINNSGKEIIKEILQRGEIFGQFTLQRNNLQGEFAQAYKEDVSLCAFNIADFEQLLRKKPDISLKFSRQLGESYIKHNTGWKISCIKTFAPGWWIFFLRWLNRSRNMVTA